AVLIHDGSVEYWPNQGYGQFGARVAMRNSPRLPDGYDPRRVLIGDVDGDGAADLVYVDDHRVTLWLDQRGNRIGDPIVTVGTPPVAEMGAVRLVDLLGNGVAGVLYSGDAGGSRDRMFFLDFTGGVKAHLLEQIDNNAGTTTRVEYAPSTRFFLLDQARRE